MYIAQMSIIKILEMNSWIRSIKPVPELVALAKAQQQFNNMRRYYAQITPMRQIQSAIPSFASLDLAPILKELEEKKALLKDSSLREALENFTADETENFLFTPTDSKDTEQSRIILDEAAQMKQIIKDIYHNNENLYTLTSRRFEELIATLLQDQGFETHLTSQTRDGGYDILAVQKLSGQYDVHFLVECKRYSSMKVGVDIVRSFSHVISTNGANKGILVTTSYFTRDAIKAAPSPYLLDFRDKDKVLDWIRAYQGK
jgi:restriction system protein